MFFENKGGKKGSSLEVRGSRFMIEGLPTADLSKVGLPTADLSKVGLPTVDFFDYRNQK